MAVLVIGADRLGKIEEQLVHHYGQIIHWTGRNQFFNNKIIPSEVDQIIIFCDFISHQAVSHIKRQAKSKGVSVQYSKRSLVGIKQI